MKILWLTWKDRKHPLAGGAEVVNEELVKRLVADGHKVIFIVGGFKGSVREEIVNGYRIVRLGNRYSVYWSTYRYYKKHLVGWADLVIDEVNTMPFFAKFYVREPNMLVVHMLCRKIWFYQMVFPLSLLGYLMEPLYLRLLKDRRVITISESTKQDLMRNGFKLKQITIMSVGIELELIERLEDVKKYVQPTLLSLGAIRPMKRTADQIKAFELAKSKVKNLKLKVAGDASGEYGKRILKIVAGSPYANDIEYLGRVTNETRKVLMQKCHLIMVTSVKEGWGLIVTEAASQGTPAVVYNVDGLRDSVQHNKGGLVCTNNTPADLATNIAFLLNDVKHYNKIRNAAWEQSKKITFEKNYIDFKEALMNE